MLLHSLFMNRGIFEADPYKAKIVAIATTKLSYSWGRVLVLGIGCNWLVNLAIWISSFYSTLTNKAIAIWATIFTFCALGFEHSVANMTLVCLLLLDFISRFLWVSIMVLVPGVSSFGTTSFPSPLVTSLVESAASVLFIGIFWISPTTRRILSKLIVVWVFELLFISVCVFFCMVFVFTNTTKKNVNHFKWLIISSFLFLPLAEPLLLSLSGHQWALIKR